MDTDFTDKLRVRLKTRWQCGEPVGCDESRIRELEQAFCIALPDTYRSFLLTCGLFAGDLFAGYNWSLESRGRRNQEFQTCLAEEGFVSPTDAFVFLDYLGDYSWYFCGAEVDPVVMLFDHDRLQDTGLRLAQFLLEWEQL